LKNSMTSSNGFLALFSALCCDSRAIGQYARWCRGASHTPLVSAGSRVGTRQVPWPAPEPRSWTAVTTSRQNPDAGPRPLSPTPTTAAGRLVPDAETLAPPHQGASPSRGPWTDVLDLGTPAPRTSRAATGRDARGRKQFSTHTRVSTAPSATARSSTSSLRSARPSGRCAGPVDADLRPRRPPRRKQGRRPSSWPSSTARLCSRWAIDVHVRARSTAASRPTTVRDRHASHRTGGRSERSGSAASTAKTGRGGCGPTPALARLVRALPRHPGPILFQWLADDGKPPSRPLPTT
jgi:hypothetical protein